MAYAPIAAVAGAGMASGDGNDFVEFGVGAVAWQVMRLSPCKDQPYVACWIGLLTLVAPSFLVAAQSYRPEIPTALLLLLAIRFWHADTKNQL